MKLLLLLVLSCAFLYGENLWVDGGCETLRQAVPGGRTGKCLSLKATKREHWLHVGLRRMTTIPFATYELTGYVKGNAAEGNPPVAFYTYNYNCYGWFGAGDPVPTIKSIPGWTRVTRRIISIEERIDVVPLAFLHAGPGELFIDDIEMRLVATPEQTIEGILAKKEQTTHERQILMRWYLEKDDVEKARAAIDPKQNREVAEFHCLMAQRSSDAETRLFHAERMIAVGCFDFPDAGKRLDELFRDVKMTDRLATCLAGMEQYAGKNKRQLMAFDSVFVPLKGRRKSDWIKRVDELKSCLEMIRKYAPVQGGLPVGTIEAAWNERIKQAEATLATILAEQGNCEVSLNGRKLQDCVIGVPAEGTESELWAAEELARYLETQTGVQVPIVQWNQVGTKYPIYVGRAPKEVGASVDYAKLGTEGIHVEQSDSSLLLCGGKRGVLYAVYEFLEERLGWRWFSKDCITFPKTGTFELGNFKKVYVPAFEYRLTSNMALQELETNVPSRLSAYHGSLPNPEDYEKWGGFFRYKGWVHTFNTLVPPSKYAHEHPEYYSLVNGKRLLDRTQLCLTNPDVLRIAKQTVRKWLEESEGKIYAVSVSQNDWHNYCQCDSCNALAEREGSQSGPLLHFVNAIAGDIAEDYPDVKIDTLAYQYTRKAPKFVKPAKNVIVRLCSIECCFVHPLDQCEQNKSFVKDIEDWSKICDYLSIWDYTINFRHSTQPFPNLRVLKPNMQFYRKYGVKAMFEQGNRFTWGGELQELRAYLIPKLLWDPDFDVEKGIREFTDAFYGPGAPFVRATIDLFHDTVCSDTTKHVRIYSHPQSYLTYPGLLDKADELMEQAEKACKGNELYANRNAVAHMPIWYAKLQLLSELYRQEADWLIQDDAPRRVEMATRFRDAAAWIGLQCLTEGGTRRGYEEWLEKHLKKPARVQIVTLTNAHGSISVVPGIGGRVWKASTADGREFLWQNAAADGGLIIKGDGYEEYSTVKYQSPGWLESYEIKERGGDFVSMAAKLSNGITLERRVQLLPDAPGFKVTTKASGNEAVTMRIHPAFAAPSLEKTSLRLKNADGSWREIPVNGRMDRYFRDDQMPNGAWAFWDANAKLGVVNQFSQDQVDACYVNASPDQKRINLEQWTKPMQKNAVIENVYRLIDSLD